MFIFPSCLVIQNHCTGVVLQENHDLQGILWVICRKLLVIGVNFWVGMANNRICKGMHEIIKGVEY